MYPEEYRYTKEHEWIDASGAKSAAVGITEHATGELGDIVYVRAPEVDAVHAADEVFGGIESVKAYSDLYMPVDAKVIEVNAGLEENPELVNQDPHGEGWICKVEVTDVGQLDALMSAAQYRDFMKEG